MKNSLTLLTACFFATLVSAQITITNNDMVSPGDTIRVSYALTTNNVDHTLTGSNYLWDFSTLQPNSQRLFEYNAPQAIPFNFLATIEVADPSPDSIPFIGYVPTNFTDYFKISSSSYRQMGLSFDYTPLGNFSVPVIFSANDYVYRFPMNYGNTDSSDAAYQFSIPNLITYGQTIHRVNYVDGWGTLITPYGTFQTLRIKSIVDRVDTIGLDSATGFNIPRPQEIQYKWLANGMDIPVLEIDAQIVLNAEVVSNVVYQDSMRSNVFQVGQDENKPPMSINQVYPNPAQENVVVAYSVAQAGLYTIEIVDLSGRLVMNLGSEENLPGSYFKTLNIENLAAGMYFIRVSSGSFSAPFPLIVGQ
jgi:Secretion system C-terminal sorting domain